MIDVSKHIPGFLHVDIPLRMYSAEAESIAKIVAWAVEITFKAPYVEKLAKIERSPLLTYVILARREDGMLAIRDPGPFSIQKRVDSWRTESIAKQGAAIFIDHLSTVASSLQSAILKNKLTEDTELRFEVAPPSSACWPGIFPQRETTTYRKLKRFRKVFMLLSKGLGGRLEAEEQALVGNPLDPIAANALALVRKEWMELHWKFGEHQPERFEYEAKKLLKPFFCNREVLEKELGHERACAYPRMKIP